MQSAESLRVHLYVKEPTREKLGGARVASAREAIVGKSLEIAGRFDDAGKRIGIRMQWKSYQWPKLQEFENKNLLGSFPRENRFPDGGEFDADMNVCILHQLHDADAVVGHLLLRNRRPFFLCLCTIDDLPDLRMESTQRMLRGLLIIPDSISSTDNNIFIPSAPGTQWTPENNPLKKGKMSIRPAHELSDTYVQSLVESVRLEKWSLQKF